MERCIAFPNLVKNLEVPLLLQARLQPFCRLFIPFLGILRPLSIQSETYIICDLLVNFLPYLQDLVLLLG